MAGRTHYAATKGGIIAFTRALAREVGPISEETRRERSAILALRRLALPEDVAPTAVFLASDGSNYYSGQTLSPNGGDVML